MAERKRRLGSGIENLIPDSGKTKSTGKQTRKPVKAKETNDNSPVMLKISMIEPNAGQPRKNFDKKALAQLSESIKIHGIIQPIVVRKVDDYYEIIAGERRWRAAKLAGLSEVPVIIKELSTREAMEIALIENIQRSDLNPIEEAKAYKSLIEEYDLKQDELALRVSKSRSAIANSMRLLKLSDKVSDMVASGKLSAGHARAIVVLEDELQSKAADIIVERDLSVRETEALIKQLQNPAKPKKTAKKTTKKDIIIDDLASQLREIVGTKVTINHNKSGKGKISIEYYSNDELDRLLTLFKGIKGE